MINQNNNLSHDYDIYQYNQQGFTLVEIMVVVVILSIFAGVVSLSVGSSDARKNRAYYEHWMDSMGYIRLLSAESMQPMGIRLVSDKQGKLVTQVVKLDNAYADYQQMVSATSQDRTKNAMELSGMSRNVTDNTEAEKQPTWTVVEEVSLPERPDGVQIDINPLEQALSRSHNEPELQPWFVGEGVPSLLWFGTGQATAVNVEIKYKGRLIGEVIQLKPDGSVQVGK